ncbi:MAG: HesB-like protein [Desulfuromonadaceae bacterium]|nr:HesB-like protein [Desulfuromonadaceae bacterium]
MIEITPKAHEVLKDYLAQNPGHAVKICFDGLGCNGPALKLALTPAGENDAVVDVDGITVILDEEVPLFSDDQVIDYLKSDIEEGFSITSRGGFSCGGDCSNCSG